VKISEVIQAGQSSPRRIDAAVAAVMAFDRACYLADTGEPQLLVFDVPTPQP